MSTALSSLMSVGLILIDKLIKLGRIEREPEIPGAEMHLEASLSYMLGESDWNKMAEVISANTKQATELFSKKHLEGRSRVVVFHTRDITLRPCEEWFDSRPILGLLEGEKEYWVNDGTHRWISVKLIALDARSQSVVAFRDLKKLQVPVQINSGDLALRGRDANLCRMSNKAIVSRRKIFAKLERNPRLTKKAFAGLEKIAQATIQLFKLANPFLYEYPVRKYPEVFDPRNQSNRKFDRIAYPSVEGKLLSDYDKGLEAVGQLLLEGFDAFLLTARIQKVDDIPQEYRDKFHFRPSYVHISALYQATMADWAIASNDPEIANTPAMERPCFAYLWDKLQSTGSWDNTRSKNGHKVTPGDSVNAMFRNSSEEYQVAAKPFAEMLSQGTVNKAWMTEAVDAIVNRVDPIDVYTAVGSVLPTDSEQYKAVCEAIAKVFKA